MKLQYISDSEGKTTAVVIPIDQWNEMKSRHIDLEDEDDFELTDEMKSMLDERIATEDRSEFLSVEEVQRRIREKYGI